MSFLDQSEKNNQYKPNIFTITILFRILDNLNKNTKNKKNKKNSIRIFTADELRRFIHIEARRKNNATSNKYYIETIKFLNEIKKSEFAKIQKNSYGISFDSFDQIIELIKQVKEKYNISLSEIKNKCKYINHFSHDFFD